MYHTSYRSVLYVVDTIHLVCSIFTKILGQPFFFMVHADQLLNCLYVGTYKLCANVQLYLACTRLVADNDFIFGIFAKEDYCTNMGTY